MIGNFRISTMDDFVRLPNHSTVNWLRNRIRQPSYMNRFGYIAVYGDGTSGIGNRIWRRKQSLSKNVIFDPKKNFIGVLYNLVDFRSKNVYLYPNRPNKVIYGYFFAFMAIWDKFVRIGPRCKKWTYLPLFVRIGQRYLKAKNKPKYSNILHILEVSTIFLHQTHKPGVISQKWSFLTPSKLSLGS